MATLYDHSWGLLGERANIRANRGIFPSPPEAGKFRFIGSNEPDLATADVLGARCDPQLRGEFTERPFVRLAPKYCGD